MSCKDLLKCHKELETILQTTTLVLKCDNFAQTAQVIFKSCKKLVGASSGYISILTESGAYDKPVYLDSGGPTCSVDPSLPMLVRGLREGAIKKGEIIYHNSFRESEFIKYLPAGHSPINNVLFSPLMVNGKSVGLLGLANKPGGFTEEDKKIITGFSELVGLALVKSRSLEQLKSSEKRFRAITQNAADGIIICDKEGRIIFSNSAVESIFSYSCAELEGKFYYEIIPNINMEYLHSLNSIVAKGSRKYYECLGKRKDGSLLPVEVSVACWTEGDDLFFSGIIRNVSERKQLERKRRYLLLENFSDIILFVDGGRNIIEANKAAVEAYQYSRPELLTLNISQLFVDQSILNQMPQKLIETQHRRKDNTLFPVELRAQAIADQEGKTSLFVIRDISHRKDMEKTLQNKEDKIKAIFDNAPLGIGVFNSEGKVIRCNNMLQEMLGYTESELKKIDYKGYTYFEDRGMEGQLLERLNSGQIKHFSIQKRYIKKNGSVFWANVYVSILDQSNEDLSKIVIVEDVTEKKQAKEELYLQQKRLVLAERVASLGTMAASIAHKINQPLNAIRVSVDGMLYLHRNSKPLEIGEIIDNLSSISDGISEINKIISEMRFLARKEHSYRLELCDLNTIIKNVLSKKVVVRGENIKVTKKLNKIPPIKGTDLILEEILVNLLHNAVDAFKTVHHHSKKIEIKTYLEKDRVVLEVSDNALGIPQDIWDRIFEPFFTTKEDGGGMGLGLTIVHSLVQLLDGKIDVFNNQKGGTTFLVKFP